MSISGISGAYDRSTKRFPLHRMEGRGAYGFEPALPETAQGKPDSGSESRIAPGSELNPHLRAVLERLKERDREGRQ